MQSKKSQTRRQQILRLVAQGLSQKEIADRLGISPAGVSQLILRMRAAGITVALTKRQQRQAQAQAERPAPLRHPAVKEAPWIKPPSLAQLMARR